MREEGVSQVIGTVLMLVIAVSLVGAAFVFFFDSVQSQKMSVFDVTSTSGSSFQLYNYGTTLITDLKASYNNTNVPVYVDCSAQPSFSDNFDDGNSNGWNVVSGNWYVSSGAYKGDSTVSGSAQSYANTTYNPASIQLDFKIGDLRPIDVMLIIDRSGSMSQNSKLANAKIAASTFIGTFNPSRDHSGLVSFNESATSDQTLTSNQTAVTAKINSLVANGNTSIGGAIYNATYELQKDGRPGGTWIEVLLTDGQPNEPNSVQYALQYTINASKNASSYGIPIYTIGLGSDVNASLLSQIANTTNGKYYFAPDSTTLGQIYAQIAGEITGGSAGIILKRGNSNITSITAVYGQDTVNITNTSGNMVASGKFHIDNNTFYGMKVVTSGSKVYVNINGTDVASADMGTSSAADRLTLFSSNSLAVFDDIKIYDDYFNAGRYCSAHLFNFTTTAGQYQVILSTSNARQTVTVSIP